MTSWRGSGEILSQTTGVAPNLTSRRAPPWSWGETDQTEPTAPWVLEGKTVDEWWDSLPEDKKRDNR